MKGSFHLTSLVADDFLHDRLSESDQSAVDLHLEECEGCRKLILFSLPESERLLEVPSFKLPKMVEKHLRLYRKWTQGSGTKIADKNLLWP